MRELILQIPDTVELENNELAFLLAAKLYEQSKLSAGQAAELAGLSKRSFIELLGNAGVSVFNYPSSELSSDIANG